MGYLAIAAVLIALIAFATIHLWLRHDRRVMMHKERMAALEKGLDLLPVEQEIRRARFSAQRILLLAGLVWIALGVAAFGLLSALAGQSLIYFDPDRPPVPFPHGLQWIGVAAAGVGVAHLVAYLLGRKESH